MSEPIGIAERDIQAEPVRRNLDREGRFLEAHDFAIIRGLVTDPVLLTQCQAEARKLLASGRRRPEADDAADTVFKLGVGHEFYATKYRKSLENNDQAWTPRDLEKLEEARKKDQIVAQLSPGIVRLAHASVKALTDTLEAQRNSRMRLVPLIKAIELKQYDDEEGMGAHYDGFSFGYLNDGLIVYLDGNGILRHHVDALHPDESAQIVGPGDAAVFPKKISVDSLDRKRSKMRQRAIEKGAIAGPDEPIDNLNPEFSFIRNHSVENTTNPASGVKRTLMAITLARPKDLGLK